MRKVVALGATGALLFGSATAALAAIAIEDVCPAPSGNEDFPDVEDGSFADEIECLGGYGIADGFDDGEYKPEVDVNRGQMAKFVWGMVETADEDTLPNDAENGFEDVTEGGEFEPFISVLEDAGIVDGVTDTMYEPAGDVTRGEMSKFIVLAIETALGETIRDDADTHPFTDVAEGGEFEEYIAALYEAEIVEGETDTTYNPNGNVDRGQMAVFIMRAAEYLDNNGAWGPTQPTTNQTFTVTGADEATNEFSTASGTTADRGQRAYNVSGLDDTKTYVIALFPAENVTVSNGGVVTFKDADGTNKAGNDVADWSMTSAVIESVNNQALGTADDGGVEKAVPVNGTLKFTIDSTEVDQVVPVIFLDADNGSVDDDGTPANNVVDLDLSSSNEPTESFGVGGRKNWIAPESAASATTQDGRVVTLDETANEFAFNGAATTSGNYDADNATLRFQYDANDQFFDSTGVPMSFEEFEEQLSRGDFVEVDVYSPTDSVVSSFTIADDSPDAPAVDADEGTTGQSTDDVTVVITPADVTNPALYDQFIIQRAAGTSPAESAYSTVATLTPSDDEDTSTSTFTWTDMNLAAGTYTYRAAGVIDGDQSGWSTTTDLTATTTAPGADTTGPTSVNAVEQTQGGLAGRADAGDVWRFVFDEALAPVAAGDQIVVVEGSDTSQASTEDRVTLTNGSNATFALNTSAETINGVSYAAGRVLRVTIDSALTGTSTGGDTIMDYPVTVQDQAGLADAAGNGWNIAGSLDKTVEADVTAPTSTSTTVTADNANDGTTATPDNNIDNGDVITITFNEAMNPELAQPVADSVTITDAGGDTVTLTHGGNATFAYSGTGNVTLTITVGAGVDTAVDYGATTLVAGSTYITDVAGHGWNLTGSADRSVN